MYSELTDASVHIPFTLSGRAPLLPNADEIAVRAYRLYEERGAAEGHDLDDWLKAERQLVLEHLESDRYFAAA